MACEDRQKAFNDKFGEVQATLKAGLAAIATDTEAKAKQIADDFDSDHELAEGVGAVAGTAIGGIVGGPAGAVVGEVIGKTIGSLFTFEVGMRRESFSLDVPQTTMETQDFSFDLPTVVVRDTDISFDIPTTEMRTVEGPPIPEMTVRMEQQCVDLGPFGRACTDVPVSVVTWKKTYLDVPVTVMKTQRIVLGLPQVEMHRQEFKMDVPVIAMRTTEFSADIPFITLRFIKDAGKRTAALAAALAQSAQDAAVQQQIGYKQRLQAEVAPLAVEMFACFRTQITDGRSAVMARFNDQIQTLQIAVTAIAANGVPEDNPELKQARSALESALAKQADALKPLDEALTKLDASSKTALDQFLGNAKSFSPAAGGLIKTTASAGKALPLVGVPGLIEFASKGQNKGLFLAIGLNRIDPAAYGDSGLLNACENDARDMADLARSAGFSGTTLLTEKATSSAVLAQLSSAAATLQSGDILFLSYSGHGGQVGDVTGDEDDALDETWCLFDRQLLDDELYAMWAKFRPGVRIVVFSDSCHSGSVTKALMVKLHERVRDFSLQTDDKLVRDLRELEAVPTHKATAGRVKALPFARSWQMYIRNKPMYDSLQILAGGKEKSKRSVEASVLLLSGCQDDELSRDGDTNGAFTHAVKEAWQAGAFNGNYRDFHRAIAANEDLMQDQNPAYSAVGAPNPAFEAQRPFSI
jgi:hypothetical protein